jgi:hypothetical protein
MGRLLESMLTLLYVIISKSLGVINTNSRGYLHVGTGLYVYMRVNPDVVPGYLISSSS